MAWKTTYVRQQLRNIATAALRFVVGTGDPSTDGANAIQPAELGVNVADGTIEVGYTAGIAQIPSRIMVDADDTKALVWNKTTKAWDVASVGSTFNFAILKHTIVSGDLTNRFVNISWSTATIAKTNITGVCLQQAAVRVQDWSNRYFNNSSESVGIITNYDGVTVSVSWLNAAINLDPSVGDEIRVFLMYEN